MKDQQTVTGRKLIDRLGPQGHWGAMRGILATTYELQPEFLETDFLPAVFGLGAWDDRSWATRIALEKRLFELDSAVILSDSRRYRGRPRSLRLEIRPIVSRRGAAFHPKVTLLLFENAVRLIVGSANLTDPGYRRNREVIAVLTASSDAPQEASLILEALSGMRKVLSQWLPFDAEKLIGRAEETLRPWTAQRELNATFLWTNQETRLWREYLNRWPAGEAIHRITIVSPFWSQDAGLTLSKFLSTLKSGGLLSPNAEVRLLTDVYADSDGGYFPILPPGYATFDWAALGVIASAQAVSPKVYPEEVGGMEDFTGTRALHAKTVLIDGSHSSLVYLGSANFTAHGWGFLGDGATANIEAGLILRSGTSGLTHLLPELIGEVVPLANGNGQALKPPEQSPEEDPWPEFIIQALLTPAVQSNSQLELRLEVSAGSEVRGWSACLPNKDLMKNEALVSTEVSSATTTNIFRQSLSASVLTRLLTEQELLICWTECPMGRLIPLNVDSSARALLPISPSSGRIQEGDLLSYYQGKIAWEDLFPDPEANIGRQPNSGSVLALATGVDVSLIQSYQIREFVEALTGLRHDLQAATLSEPSMRLALLGPVSPLALAQTVLEAVKAGRRTPTGGAFQFVEILACLHEARFFKVQDRVSAAWRQNLADTTAKTNLLFDELWACHGDELSLNKSFTKYRKTILNTKVEAGG